MEKLSHILSSSGHYNVDLSKERPLRAGASSFFGQPISSSRHVYENTQNAYENETPRNDNERHGDIVDKVNFSFAKRPELQTMEEAKEDIANNKIENPAIEPTSKTDGAKEAKESSGHKNVNLSIYV